MFLSHQIAATENWCESAIHKHLRIRQARQLSWFHGGIEQQQADCKASPFFHQGYPQSDPLESLEHHHFKYCIYTYILVGSGWWFHPPPLKNDGVHQLGLWHAQYDGKVIKFHGSSHHQHGWKIHRCFFPNLNLHLWLGISLWLGGRKTI
jgi:hypothetical protein